MLELGKRQTLEVVKTTDFGVYLADPADTQGDQVLLPAKQVPDGCAEGSQIPVFLYRDSRDRMIATVRTPALQLHQTALLSVREVTRVGAFLDWGLEKDLLLPFREQTRKVQEGEQVLCALYLDKSGRLCATMKLYPYLEKFPPYSAGDVVDGRIYETSRNFGVFVAVDDRYSALIPKRDAQGTFIPGQIMSLRIASLTEDGKLTVTPKKKAYLQMDEDAAKILQRIQDLGGELPYDDSASPEQINKDFGISKAAFKRAAGRLLKSKTIVKESGKLRRVP